MSKYWAVFKITVRNWLEYTWDNTIVLSRTIIYFLALYYLWTTVFAKQQNLFGYSLATMLTYVFVSFAIRNFVLSTRVDQISDSIAHGEFFSFLLRPISIIGYWLSLDLAYKIFDLALAIVALGVIYLILRPTLVFNITPFSATAFLAILILCSLIYFFLMLSVALTAFWSQTTWGFQFALSLLIEFASGLFFPIDVLPTTLAAILKYTPFPYMIWLPANILTGRIDQAQIIQGLGTSVVWTLMLGVFVWALWRKGIRNYSAEGG